MLQTSLSPVHFPPSRKRREKQMQNSTKEAAAKCPSDATTPKSRRSKPRAPRPRTFTLTRDVPHVGFVRGEVISATRTAEIKIWDIALAERRGESAGVGRVVAVTEDSITIRRVEGDETYDRRELAFLGRVNPESVGKDDGLTDEQRATLKKLRAKLEAVAGEDDQIIRCSARYEIEKEIFDIKHPAGEGKELDDWGAWEESPPVERNHA